MGYEDAGGSAPPVTDWVNDWDWLDSQWGQTQSTSGTPFAR